MIKAVQLAIPPPGGVQLVPRLVRVLVTAFHECAFYLITLIEVSQLVIFLRKRALDAAVFVGVAGEAGADAGLGIAEAPVRAGRRLLRPRDRRSDGNAGTGADGEFPLVAHRAARVCGEGEREAAGKRTCHSRVCISRR